MFPSRAIQVLNLIIPVHVNIPLLRTHVRQRSKPALIASNRISSLRININPIFPPFPDLLQLPNTLLNLQAHSLFHDIGSFDTFLLA
jgi:hypothetical protein